MNNKTLSLFAATLLLVSQPICAGHYVPGTELASWLKADDRVKSGTGDRSDVNESFKAAGYLMGVLDGFDGQICHPKDMSLGQAKLIVAKFLADNPKYLNLNASSLVIGSMREAFPCASK